MAATQIYNIDEAPRVEVVTLAPLGLEGEVWSRVRDFAHYAVSDRGRILGLRRGGIIQQFLDGQDYAKVKMSRCGFQHSQSVARIVAAHHVPNPLGLPEVNHLDTVKLHNEATNLEWTTRSGNMLHRWFHTRLCQLWSAWEAFYD
jgi:hypothetical protein